MPERHTSGTIDIIIIIIIIIIIKALFSPMKAREYVLPALVCVSVCVCLSVCDHDN